MPLYNEFGLPMEPPEPVVVGQDWAGDEIYDYEEVTDIQEYLVRLDALDEFIESHLKVDVIQIGEYDFYYIDGYLIDNDTASVMQYFKQHYDWKPLE